MNNSTETIVDDNGIEILVDYDWEESPSQIEFGHGEHEVGLQVYTELKSVEVVIGGKGIDLLPLMDEKQKTKVIDLLTYP